MKITFILHSSFLVELETCTLLFDYYEGTVPAIPQEKPLYVFASHSHGDHFSKAIFTLAEKNRDIRFFLSDDIPKNQVPPALLERTFFVAPHQVTECEGLRVATLQSTDMGVAFLLECEGKRLYHAGDLNCWVWSGAPRFQNDRMLETYCLELENLKGKPIDVAFVPLDARQEEYFDLGMRYFLEAADVKTVFPMHMWEDYSVIPRFKALPQYENEAFLLQNITAPGQSFTL